MYYSYSEGSAFPGSWEKTPMGMGRKLNYKKINGLERCQTTEEIRDIFVLFP